MKHKFNELRQLLHPSGLGMTQALIGAGMMGITALIGVTVFKNQNVGQKTIESSYELATVLADMRSILSDPENCSETMKELGPAGGVPTGISKKINGSFEIVYRADTALPGSLIKVKSYALDRSFSNLASNETMLKVLFSTGKATLRDEITKHIKISYSVDGSGNIQACNAVTDTSQIWQRAVIDPLKIFYSGGFVGVNVSEPDDVLHVRSDSSGRALIRVENFDTSGSASAAFGAFVQGGTGSIVHAATAAGATSLSSGPYRLGTTNASALELSTNGVQRLVVGVSGNVGIGVANPTAKLDVNGVIRGQSLESQTEIRAASFLYTSDARLKSGIVDVKNSLDRVGLLRGREFIWRDTGERDLGFIAQEVKKVEPALVRKDSRDQMAVKYGNITALLVEAVKELRRENAELRERLKEQDARIRDIEKGQK